MLPSEEEAVTSAYVSSTKTCNSLCDALHKQTKTLKTLELYWLVDIHAILRILSYSNYKVPCKYVDSSKGVK